MASDNLKQVGGYIRDTRKKANHALNRYSKNLPIVETTRDIFDPTVPFDMFFRTSGEKELKLEIKLMKPPPLRGCKSGCHISACEEFSLSSGAHIISLEHVYIPGTVDVFVNNVPDLGGGEYGDSTVYTAGGSSGTNTIVVCYIWSNC